MFDGQKPNAKTPVPESRFPAISACRSRIAAVDPFRPGRNAGQKAAADISNRLKGLLKYGVPAFSIADADGVFAGNHENLTVTNSSGLGGSNDCADNLIDARVRHDQFKFHFGNEVHFVLGSAICLGVTLLATVAA